MLSAAINFAFVILIIINVTSNYEHEHNIVDHFCQQSNNITNAFIIGHNIYLGSDDNHFWVYSLKMNAIINRLMTDNIFPQYPFDDIQTAVVFDFRPCVSYFGDQHCNTAGNAKNLVMVLGHNDNNYLYTSYRLDDNGVTLRPIESDNDMPWSLSRNGSVNSNQLFKFDSSSLKLFGLTFLTAGGQQLLLSSAISVNDRYKGEISSKAINSTSGNIDLLWFLEKEFGIYYGLFDVNGVVYGLSDGQLFERLEWNDDFVSVANYTEKELFNCYKNSSLITNTTESDPITITTTTDEQLSNSTAFIPLNDTTLAGNGRKKKSSYTPKRPMTGKLAILMLALLVVMALVLTFIYFRCFRNRIRTEDDESKSVPEADSLVKSEDESGHKSDKLETKSSETVDESKQNAKNSDKKSRESLTQ